MREFGPGGWLILAKPLRVVAAFPTAVAASPATSAGALGWIGAVAGRGMLFAGQSLSARQRLVSPGGNYGLVMQGDRGGSCTDRGTGSPPERCHCVRGDTAGRVEHGPSRCAEVSR